MRLYQFIGLMVMAVVAIGVVACVVLYNLPQDFGPRHQNPPYPMTDNTPATGDATIPAENYIEIETADNPAWSVIWLHGLGADGHDFEPLVPELAFPGQPPMRFIFPHAPVRPITINGGMEMRGWYDITGMAFDRQEDLDGFRESDEIVQKYIARENQRGVDNRHIILAGFSQGGAVSLYSGLRMEHPPAAILALSTYLPLADRLATEASPNSPGVPIFMAHGLYDPVIPLALAERSKEHLTDAGYQLAWHTYPMPHSVSADEITDITGFLKKIVTE